MRIFFIASDDKGSGYYRMQLPAKYLGEKEDCESFHVIAFSTSKAYEKTDVIVYQRQHDLLDRIKREQSKGKKIIYELDDNLWHIPYSCSHFISYWTPERVRSVGTLISASDKVVASTEVLAQELSRLNKNVVVRPNYIEMPDEGCPRTPDEPIRIGWAGCPSHRSDFDSSIIQALKDIKNEYKDRVELVFLGILPYELLGMAMFYRYVEPENYLNFLQSVKLDIGIIPCQLNRFNDSRSNLKFLEFSAVKAVSIASPVYPYRTTIKDGLGFLIKKNRYKEWHRTIKMLIEDESLRRETAERAYSFVAENYCIENKKSFLEDVYLN